MRMRFILMLCVLLAGCAGKSVTGPQMDLSIALDRTEYKIGQPLVATVQLKNNSSDELVVPRFDAQSLQFMTGKRGLNTRVHRHPVHSKNVIPESREIEPNGTFSRQFLFTRATKRGGDYVLTAIFKGAVQDEKFIEQAVYARPVPFRVTEEVVLKRDPSDGRILKTQAVELARKSAAGEVIESRAVLVPLKDTGLVTWVVMLRVKKPNGKELRYAVQVDPYVGKVRRLESKKSERERATPGNKDPQVRASRTGSAAGTLVK